MERDDGAMMAKACSAPHETCHMRPVTQTHAKQAILTSLGSCSSQISFLPVYTLDSSMEMQADTALKLGPGSNLRITADGALGAERVPVIADRWNKLPS